MSDFADIFLAYSFFTPVLTAHGYKALIVLS